MGLDSEIPPNLLIQGGGNVLGGLANAIPGWEHSGEFEMRSTEEMLHHIWQAQHPAGGNSDSHLICNNNCIWNMEYGLYM